MASYTDYLWTSTGGTVTILGGLWVRLHNNNTGTDYYSSAVTDASTGAFTHSAPTGDYSLYSGTAATVGGTPNLRNGHYAVAARSGDDPAFNSATIVGSPFAPQGNLPIGSITGKALDFGGFAYNIRNPSLGALVLDDGSNQAANINTCLSNVPANTIVYWPSSATNYGIGGSITGVKANQTHIGAGRFSAIVKRLNTTNQKMFALESLAGVTVMDMGFDANGLNQSSNQEVLRFDGTSSNELVERCNFINVALGAVFIFGGPTARSLNPRFWNSDVTPISSAANDLVTMVAEGGSTVNIRVNNGHTAFCINIYEANNHPCIGATETLSGNGGTGIAFSSCHRCPGIGNTITCGANDVGITVIKETDNANARPSLDQSLVGNSLTGLSASSIAYRLTSCSNVHIQGGSLDTFSIGVNYNGGAGLAGITVADVEFLNVINPWLGTVPSFTWWHHNPGVNPFGNLAAPTIPAASVDVINNFSTNALVQPSTASTSWLLGFQPPPILLLTTTTTGGTLAPGTYAYRVSLVDQQGGESLASTEVTIVVPAGTSTNTVTILWYQQGAAARAGAQTSFRVYGRTSGAELRMATGLTNTNTWIDTGSVTPSGALPATNGTARSLGTTTGPFIVPANQTLQFTGAAPGAWVWTGIE